MIATKMNGYIEGRVRQSKSPNTQGTDFSLRAMKIYGNAESHAKSKEDFWEATDSDAEGCN